MTASSARILIVGVGGVGAPAALALVEAGVTRLALADDDAVDVSNLHRQILFDDRDVGRPKLDATRDALARRRAGLEVELRPGRALPSTALELVRGFDAVVDATDNFATRFLLADACGLARVPVVHAAAVGWRGTVLAVRENGAPCYRCLFEDVPAGPAPDCATAGVVGPVCGVIGAIAADAALALAARGLPPPARIATYDGRADALRFVAVSRRESCPLCGPEASIRDLEEARYLRATCGADAA